MVFSSPIFLFLFLPLIFLAERLCPGLRQKNTVLALGSLIFYSFGQLWALPLFLLSVTVNYLAGLLLSRDRGVRNRRILTVAVLLNVATLAVFKYTEAIVTGLGFPSTGIVLPIGISFYTFQGMSYVIDVYRDRSHAAHSFGKLLLYLAFFPQLIAGPIVKYHDISAQIDQRRTTPARTEEGLCRFLLGLGKKLLIADAVGLVADTAFLEGVGHTPLAWLGALCYSLQIYYDFSGYSDMAIGMGAMFGFTFAENFLHPYAARSIRDFWRRWHISLSSWFREYLYIPLGGSRRGQARAALNRFLVFLCTGLWHGANWTFLVWGLGHGLFSSLEGALGAERLRKSRLGRLLGRGYTLLLVTLLFVVFRAENLAAAGAMLAAMFAGSATRAGGMTLISLLQPASLLALGLAILFAGGLRERLYKRLTAPCFPHLARLGSLALLALCILSLSTGGFHPFLYFQF